MFKALVSFAVLVISAAIGLTLGFSVAKPYLVSCVLSVLAYSLLLAAGKRRMAATSAAVLLVASVVSSREVALYAPVSLLNLAKVGQLPSTPLAIELLSDIRGREYGVYLLLSAMWSLLVASHVLLMYASYLLFRHSWMIVEKVPCPLARSVSTTARSVIAGKRIGFVLILLAVLLAYFPGSLNPAAGVATLAASLGLLSTFSFAVGVVAGAVGALVGGTSFSMGAQVGLLAYILLLYVLARRGYPGYDVHLPAPATLTLISIAFMTPVLVFLASFFSAFYIVAFIVLSVVSSLLMLRLEGDYTAIIVSELCYLIGTVTLTPALIRALGYVLGLRDQFLSSLLYVVSIPQLYALTFLALVMLDEAGEVKKFRGAAPIALVAALCPFASSILAWHYKVSPSLHAAPWQPVVTPTVEAVPLVVGCLVTLVAALVQLAASRSIPLSPAGVVLGALFMSCHGPSVALPVVIAVFVAMLVKVFSLTRAGAEAGLISQYSSLAAWGAILGLALLSLLGARAP